MIRPVLITITISFAVAVFTGTLFYGPSRRVFLVPPKIELVSAPTEILKHWESSGVKGRVALVFSRRLNAEEPTTTVAGKKYIQQAMHQGVIRKVFHVVPDSSWAEVSSNLSKQHRIPSGFILPLDDGRVIVMPLSQFTHYHELPGEQFLAVLEEGIWTPSELELINNSLKEQRIAIDYFSLIGGDSSLLALFKNNVPLSK